MEDTDPDPLPEDNLGGEYEVFMVDTDINDIIAYNSDVNRMGPARNDSEVKTKYLPREEWNKRLKPRRILYLKSDTRNVLVGITDP
jgi:hypothetical protein